MNFRGTQEITNTICIIDNTLEQINTFNYLGYNGFFEGEKDLNVKNANVVKILGIINHIFKSLLVSMHIRIRIYGTMW